jgi:hypothetical protein
MALHAHHDTSLIPESLKRGREVSRLADCESTATLTPRHHDSILNSGWDHLHDEGEANASSIIDWTRVQPPSQAGLAALSEGDC